MSIQMVLLPVFVLVGLSFALLLWTGSRRGALGERANLPAAGEVLADPLQLAMLFYVLIAIALPLRRVDLVLVLLSWVFVAIRIFHGWLAVGAGGSGRGQTTYLSSALVLLAMWVYFALRMLFLL